MRSVVGPFLPWPSLFAFAAVSCAVATKRGPLPSCSREPRSITNFTLCTERPTDHLPAVWTTDRRPPTTDLKSLTLLLTQIQTTDNSIPTRGSESKTPARAPALHCSLPRPDPTPSVPSSPSRPSPLPNLSPSKPLHPPQVAAPLPNNNQNQRHHGPDTF